MSKFIIESSEAIWGAGDTEAAAWADSEKWLDTSNPDWKAGKTCYSATEALVAEFRSPGGVFGWGKLADGTHCTITEEDAAKVAARKAARGL
jgi:hypothetical protein